jgi:iron complex outermembrane receptor protein
MAPARHSDWSVGGDSSLAGVTGFGTWGNQQVKATDSEDWINVDFTQALDLGAFKSVDFGARYADHERKTESPEGASPGRHLVRPAERRDRCVSE